MVQSSITVRKIPLKVTLAQKSANHPDLVQPLTNIQCG